MSTKAVSLFDRAILRQAALDSVTKLNPRAQLKNPVMFVTLIGALTFLPALAMGPVVEHFLMGAGTLF